MSIYEEALEDANDFTKKHIKQYRLITEKELESLEAKKEDLYRCYMDTTNEVDEMKNTLSLVENHLHARNS